MRSVAHSMSASNSADFASIFSKEYYPSSYAYSVRSSVACTSAIS
ncbi:hypothetical protein [Kineococcus aurantiacus]